MESKAERGFRKGRKRKKEKTTDNRSSKKSAKLFDVFLRWLIYMRVKVFFFRQKLSLESRSEPFTFDYTSYFLQKSCNPLSLSVLLKKKKKTYFCFFYSVHYTFPLKYGGKDERNFLYQFKFL